jgi:uncharacterized membrane-anchored protein
MTMRTAWLAAGLAISLIVANWAIGSREATLRDGRTVLLELAPVDPRSLMQGDYMALDFAVAMKARDALDSATRDRGHGDGYLVLGLDAQNRADLVRVQPGIRPLAGDELALRYRLRADRVRIVTNAWFFPEGQAARYEQARFGELRVGDDGEALLVTMRDANLKPL